MAKYKAPEVRNISNDLSLEDTVRALADSALTGLEHYAKLKGSENRSSANNAIKVLNNSVSSLSWETSTPEDFENALAAVDNLNNPDSMKGLSNSTQDTIASAANIYRSKIEKEQALRSQADVAEADLNILLNKLDSLGNSALGNSEYDTVEALEVLEQIRLAKQHNIKEISNYLDKQASEKLLQGNNELATRNLLQSIDMDKAKDAIGIQVSEDTSNFYKEALSLLGLNAELEMDPDSENYGMPKLDESGYLTYNVGESTLKVTPEFDEYIEGAPVTTTVPGADEKVIDIGLNPDSVIGQAGAALLENSPESMTKKTITIDSIDIENNMITTSEGEEYYFDSTLMPEGTELSDGDELNIDYSFNTIYGATKKGADVTTTTAGEPTIKRHPETKTVEWSEGDLATWNVDFMTGKDGMFNQAANALDAFNDAKIEMSEDQAQFTTGRIIGIVDKGINAVDLGGIDTLKSSKIISYYFDEAEEPKEGMPNYESEKAAYDLAQHLKSEYLEGDTTEQKNINKQMMDYRNDLFDKATAINTATEEKEALKNDAINRVNRVYSSIGISQIDEKSEEFSPTMAKDIKINLGEAMYGNIDWGTGGTETGWLPGIEELQTVMESGKNTDTIMKQFVNKYLGRDGRELNKRDVMLAFEVIDNVAGGTDRDKMEAVTRFYDILRAFDSTNKIYGTSNSSFAE